jgi:hypothetical protein
LDFPGLSYGNAAKALSRFVKQNHVAIWKGFKNTNLKEYHTKVSEFIIYETQIKVCNDNYF